MKNQLILISEEDIKNKIYIIRGKEVMLDSDLARIYECTNGTKDINKAVSRNLIKFPEDFYFQLTEEECLRFQNGTLNKSGNLRGQHIKYLPHVFTEQGVAMLASVLKTNKASEVSINIMRAFVAMRHILKDNIEYQKELFIMQNKITNIDNKLLEYDSKFDEIFSRFNTEEIFKSKILYEGEFYDAYSLLLDIFNKAKNELIIIDNYCDKKVLDLICDLKVKVTVISKNMDKVLIDKYQKQYNNLTIIHSETFHDRFIIVDNIELYNLGSSIKDIGKKCFSINKINKDELDSLLNNIKKEG